MPQFNTDRFLKMCRTVTQAEIGEALGIGQKAVSVKLKCPENIKIREFLLICELIDEQPETFIETQLDSLIK